MRPCSVHKIGTQRLRFLQELPRLFDARNTRAISTSNHGTSGFGASEQLETR